MMGLDGLERTCADISDHSRYLCFLIKQLGTHEPGLFSTRSSSGGPLEYLITNFPLVPVHSLVLVFSSRIGASDLTSARVAIIM
jgi:hypothetical protein